MARRINNRSIIRLGRVRDNRGVYYGGSLTATLDWHDMLEYLYYILDWASLDISVYYGALYFPYTCRSAGSTIIHCGSQKFEKLE